MIAQEVTELRKEGKLKEAYEMGVMAVTEEPDNIWNKRALAWVYFELLKNAIEKEEFKKAPQILSLINKLEMPDAESMFFENIAWKVGVILFRLKKQKNVDYKIVNQIFDAIKSFPFPKPSEPYTFLYKSFHQHNQSWNNYLIFAEWWDFTNFRQEDYSKEELDNGRRIMSIVEQAYIAYSKNLLAGISSNSFHVDYEQKIKEFLPRISLIIEDYPEYQYPIYYKAKLLHAIGDEQKALESLLPFAREKNSEFWVWSLLSEIVSDNDLQLACLSKALSCNADPEYVVKVRETLASKLIDIDLLQEAKTEIEQVLKIREHKDWKKSESLKNWINSEWYPKTEVKKSNAEFYEQWTPKTEELLYHDIEPVQVIVDYVNEEKRILNFIDEERNTGFFSFGNKLDEVSTGDLLNIRFRDKDGDYHAIYTAEKIPNAANSSLLKSFSGECKIITGKNFGFVEDIFIVPELVDIHGLINGQHITGKAMPSYDEKKNQWGWIVLEITEVE